MVTLRSRRFLQCFYCGQRSSIRFDAQKSFHCSNCDATNWLDQNGDITEPPAATESPERNNVQYAIPRPSTFRSPSPLEPAVESPAGDSVFCATCLRNQHMLSSSLAQFEWPEDCTGAEHSARERKYWSLKKTLEKRYPQVCAECLPKVNERLNQASYTAQTDHLRRMIDRTRSQRTDVKRRGILDVIDFLGRLIWHAGFALQAAWHITVVSLLFTELYASIADGHWMSAALGVFRRMNTLMFPYSDRLMQWAISLGMCSFLWNPRFKQSIRGFTAHLLGFRQWYTYQLLVLLVRFVALSISQYSKAQGLPATTQLSAQFVIPLFMIYLYLTAKKSIHTDTSPLFRQQAELMPGLQVQSDSRSPTKDPDDLGNILDEILHPPSAQQDQAVGASPRQSTSLTTPPAAQTYGKRIVKETLQFPEEQPSITHYDEEMDWSPSASQHRAFSSYNPYRVKNINPRFSDAPTEPKSGPIWYKVPPAPTNPAQRLRNPPMRPIIRESPKEKKENFFQSTGRQLIQFGSGPQQSSAELSMAPPKFYAPEPKDDPRDGLSSMFASSFSISPSPEERRNFRSGGTLNFQGSEVIPNRIMTRTAELIALLAALCGWIFALRSDELYGRTAALASVIVCLIVSIRLAADLAVDHKIRGDARPLALTRSLANIALVQVIVIILFVCNLWSGGASWVSSGVYGNTLFGGVIIHHMLHIFA
ncbi:hypothetical protein NUW58_g6805 [Xylaria curta]|uniref:Uncharacterized protein n=1 Tax=Xylaria curta TaxID=42375 RepID=A0ACC1NPC7_9PEZI|nr:hypothetical protein NUW58_g6805 [Xylaria curta]